VSEANPLRGEAAFMGRTLRPTFAALVAAEAELGPLLALVDREAVGEAVVAAGLAAAMPALRVILHQILAGTS
jgi:hypothetical protein